MEKTDFLCGAGREIITPKIGTELYGYRPGIFSTVVHDDLTVTALALGDGENTALLISITVGDIQTALATEVRTKVSEATGVPFKNIMFCATHTHCAPNVSGVDGWGEINREYIDELFIPMTVKASKDAINSMVYAEVSTATGDSDVGINRRQQYPNGMIGLGQNPWGSYDKNMTIMVFRNKETKAGILNVIHYGCHGTACGAGTEITRDWSGPMIDRIEGLSKTMTVFFNGAIGDVGPRLTNGSTVGDITYVDELGSAAAMDAIRIIRQCNTFYGAEFKIHNDVAHLPQQPFPSIEEVKRVISEIPNPDQLVNIERLRYSHYKDVEAILEKDPNARVGCYDIDLSIVTLGDIAFIPYPFEIFSEISNRLRAYTGYAHTLCLSCANGYEGYLPSEDQLVRDGYEVGVFRFAMPYSLADNTDQNLINETLRIINI